MGTNRLPKRLSQKKAQKLLEQEGWTVAVGGKHVVKMTKEGHRPITLPIHHGEEWGARLTSDILRQAGLKGPAAEDDTPEAEQEGGGR